MGKFYISARVPWKTVVAAHSEQNVYLTAGMIDGSGHPHAILYTVHNEPVFNYRHARMMVHNVNIIYYCYYFTFYWFNCVFVLV